MTGLILIVVFGTLLLAAAVFWIYGERGRLLLPSTWSVMRAGGLRNFFNMNALHAYIYGRWTNLYLNLLLNKIFPRLGERGKKWWRDRYHAKVLTNDQAKSIILLNHDIQLQDLEQVIPYPMARDLVLKGPPDVAAYECGCRHARVNSCQPTQVCMVIGQPFVDFILEHNPHTSRRLTQTEALDLLSAEQAKGHVHTAWFKDVLLDRFYSICNCCKCCCGGIEAMVKYGNPIISSSGYVAQVIDGEECTSCGLCVEFCPFSAFSINGPVEVNWEKCMGCGVCVEHCPSHSLELVRDERKGIPLDVRIFKQKENA